MINCNAEKAKNIFNQANGFLKLIDGSKFIALDPMYQNPFYINCLFCCELYLKTLLILDGKNEKYLSKKGHKLLNLFNSLKKKDQEQIKEILQIEIDEDVITYLDRINNDFVKMRYVYVNGEDIDAKEFNNNYAKTIGLMYRLQNYVSIRLFGRDTYEEVLSSVNI